MMAHLLSFKHHVERTVIRCKCGLAALKAMMATNMEKSLFFLLFNHLVVSVIDYGQGILTLFMLQCEKHERIQKEGIVDCFGSFYQNDKNMKKYRRRGWRLSWILYQNEDLYVWTDINEV